MAVPTAPAAGEPIAEAWGDVVHDAIVARDIQAGVANPVGNNTNLCPPLRVVFPRPFAVPPIVVVACTWSYMLATPGAIDVNGFTLNCRRVDGSNTANGTQYPTEYIAIGARA